MGTIETRETPAQIIKNIETRANAIGLTLSGLACRAGISKASVFRWRAGRTPSRATLDFALAQLMPCLVMAEEEARRALAAQK